MAELNLIQVAKVLKSNGTEGGLILGFRDFLPEDIDTKEPVFIEFDGLPVPFFFEEYTVKGNRAVIRFTDISSLEDAEEVVGRAVFASEEALPESEEGMESLEGWSVFDGEGNEIGTVTGYEDIPGNLCIYITNSAGKEAMAPLQDELVLGLDEDNRIIQLDLPEGLFEL